MMLRTVQGRAEGPKALFRSDVEVAVLTAPVPYGNTRKSYGFEDRNEYQVAKDDHVALRFRLYNAWPTSVVYSDLNAGDNALMVERMTLVHEGLDVSFGRQTAAGLVDADDFGLPN